MRNNTYHCFKVCNDTRILPLGEEAFTIAKNQMLSDLKMNFSLRGGNETQYSFIEPRIIVEKDILTGQMRSDVTHWYVASGVPLFASHQCTGAKSGVPYETAKRAWVSTNFNKLPMVINRPNCREVLKEPSYWKNQVQVVRDLAANIPGWCRIDLYAGENSIFFSEFTFTPFACPKNIVFKPLVVGGILLAVADGDIDPKNVTAEFIENTIGNKSWIRVSMLSLNSENAAGLQIQSFSEHPSPVDLCTTVENVATARQDAYLRCVGEARKISVDSCELRFMVVIDNGEKIESITECAHWALNWKDIGKTEGIARRFATLEDILRAHKWSGQNRIVRMHAGFGAFSDSRDTFISNSTPVRLSIVANK